MTHESWDISSSKYDYWFNQNRSPHFSLEMRLCLKGQCHKNFNLRSFSSNCSSGSHDTCLETNPIFQIVVESFDNLVLRKCQKHPQFMLLQFPSASPVSSTPLRNSSPVSNNTGNECFVVVIDTANSHFAVSITPTETVRYWIYLRPNPSVIKIQRISEPMRYWTSQMLNLSELNLSDTEPIRPSLAVQILK